MNKYIIGIDGGGTKTLGVVWDKNQNKVEEYVTGFSNFAVSVDTTKKHLEEILLMFLNKYGKESKVLIGVSGISTLTDVLEYENYLKEKYFSELKIVADGLLALYSIDGFGPKIMAIGGTGSAIFSIHNDQVKTIGGHGHILGDEGSAYHLVVEAARHVVNYFDKNDKFDNFSAAFLKKIGINSIVELKNLVYNSSKREIASFAVKVNDLAEEGNQIAIDLLKTEGFKLGEAISALYNKNNFNENVIIALRGSFASKSKMVKAGIVQALTENNLHYSFETKENDPVIGALNYYHNH